jgi:hypothetical protein
VAVMVWIGIYPGTLFTMIEEPVNYIVRKVDPQYFTNEAARMARERGHQTPAAAPAPRAVAGVAVIAEQSK